MRAIAAMSKNRVIGNGSSIPWRIPDEFKWFRRMTLNGVVIMGRRTFESLPKPLEQRVNVVLTRHPRKMLADESVQEQLKHAVVGSAARGLHDDLQLSFPQAPRTQVRLVRGMESLARAGITDWAWLCGGAQVYQQFLPKCSELYLSVIDREVEGDTLFPPFEHLFELAGTVAEFPDFRVLRYVRTKVRRAAGTAPRRLPQGMKWRGCGAGPRAA
jgi:dihydrofolate reductase